MLEKADIEKIEKMNSNLSYIHKSFTSRDSKCYEHFKKVMDHAVAEKSLTRMNKELIAVGISAYANCEACLNWHIREALKEGATEDQVIEALEVAVEMGGGTVVARGATYAFKVLEYYRNKGK